MWTSYSYSCQSPASKTERGLAKFLATAFPDFSENEISEDEGAVKVVIDLPGVPKSDLSLELKDDVLTVSGKKKGKEFSRQYLVDESVTAEDVSAVSQDGVLTITIKKPAHAPPVKIEIQ